MTRRSPHSSSDRRRTTLTALLAVVLVAASLITLPLAARHAVDDGPIFSGAPRPLEHRGDERQLTGLLNLLDASQIPTGQLVAQTDLAL